MDDLLQPWTSDAAPLDATPSAGREGHRAKRPGDRRLVRRLIGVSLLICLGIIVPALFLTYFGFRSFSYERLLVRQEREQRFAKAADGLQASLGQSLAPVLKGMTPLGLLPAPATLSQALAWIETRDVKGLRVGPRFVVDEAGRLDVPRHQPPTPPAAIDWGSYQPFIRALEQREWVQKDVEGAIAGYQRLRRQPMDDRMQAALLKRLANAYRRQDLKVEAAACLREVIDRFGSTPDPMGYATGYVGLQLLQRLHDASPAEAAKDALRLYEALVVERWPIAEADRRRLMDETGTFLATHAPEALRPAFEAARSAAPRIDAWRAAAAKLVAQRWPSIRVSLLQQGWHDSGAFFCDSNDCVAAVPLQGSRWLLATVPAQALESLLRQRLAELITAGGVPIEWDGAKAPAREALSRTVPRVAPRWSFHAVWPAQDPAAQVAQRRQWAFVGVIALSFLTMLAGGLTMLQAIRQELRISAMKADFVANVSHELRTPLTAISYIGDRLQAGRLQSPEQAQHFYRLLSDETKRLRDLIEEILDFSKMMQDKKTYQFEPSDLGMLAEEAVQRIQLKAEVRRIRIRFDRPQVPVVLDLDPKSIVQAIMNLLDNAIKYSADADEVQLSVAPADGGGSVTVKDQGIGIQPDNQERIFEKFFRAEEALTRTSDGVGLGLAMVRHIVNGHGGRISLQSDPGKGSAFTLWFPERHS